MVLVLEVWSLYLRSGTSLIPLLQQAARSCLKSLFSLEGAGVRPGGAEQLAHEVRPPSELLLVQLGCLVWMSFVTKVAGASVVTMPNLEMHTRTTAHLRPRGKDLVPVPHFPLPTAPPPHSPSLRRHDPEKERTCRAVSPFPQWSSV